VRQAASGALEQAPQKFSIAPTKVQLACTASCVCSRHGPETCDWSTSMSAAAADADTAKDHLLRQCAAMNRYATIEDRPACASQAIPASPDPGVEIEWCAIPTDQEKADIDAGKYQKGGDFASGVPAYSNTIGWSAIELAPGAMTTKVFCRVQDFQGPRKVEGWCDLGSYRQHACSDHTEGASMRDHNLTWVFPTATTPGHFELSVSFENTQDRPRIFSTFVK
jgi:hypothetical protein